MEFLNIINIDVNKYEGIYNKYSELISSERREKISRIKPEKDKILSFFAEVEMRLKISEFSEIPYRKIKFNYNQKGKPYIKDFEYNFSVSHSGNIIAFTLSEEPVGIDIEYMKSPRLRVAERFFTEHEYNYIINSELPELEFYKIWTSKESYLKMLGTGLSKSLKSFDVLSDELKSYFFTEQLEKYMLTVCRKNAVNMNYKVNFSDAESLLKSLEQFQE